MSTEPSKQEALLPNTPLTKMAVGGATAGLAAALGWLATELLDIRAQLASNHADVAAMLRANTHMQDRGRESLQDMERRVRVLEYAASRAGADLRPKPAE